TAQQREVRATVRLDPPDAAEDAAWLQTTAWQDGKLVVDRLERVGNGVYRSTRAIPVYGDWKTTLRLQDGRTVAGLPIYMPKDTAIPAPEVPARAQFTRPFVNDHDLLQRERKKDAPGWLWAAAAIIVLALYVI